MTGYYSAPQSYSPYFAGGRRQVVGGIFGSIARALLPKVKEFGKAAAKRAVGTAVNVANDVISGQSVGDSLKTRGGEFLKRTMDDGLSRLSGMKRPQVLLGTTSTSLPPKRLRTDFKQRKKKGGKQRGKGLF